MKNRQASVRERPLFEELEPRILYSADAGAVLHPDALTPSAEVRVLDLPNPSSSQTTTTQPAIQTHEIVFVDTAVNGYQQLVDDILANQSETRQIDVVLLDATRDGIAQITETLVVERDVSAIHIISHGSDGQVQLGGIVLNSNTLQTYATSIAAWSEALNANADILIYGCDVVDSASGQQLIDALAYLTGADVAGSDDATGHISLGGDWQLEAANGVINTSIALSDNFQTQWMGLLPTYAESLTFPNEQEVKSDANAGQTFSVSGSGTYLVNEISLALRWNGVTNQNITMTLLDSWGDLTPYSSVTIAASSLGVSGSVAFVNFTLPSDVTLNYGTTYFIRVTTSTPAGGVYAGFNPSASYADGARLDVAGSPVGIEDLAFKVGYTAPVNTAPVINLPNSGNAVAQNVAENTTAVADVDATDAESNTITYSLSGVDAGLFSINSATGVVSFIAAPNFEVPLDVGGNNIYNFNVVATDNGAGNLTDTQTFAITINNLDEVAPTITSGASATAINENSGANQVVYTVTSTDSGDIATGATSYSLGGADAALFGINSVSGAVTLLANPNFEAKASYSFSVTATDAAANFSTQAVTLAINNVNDAPATTPVTLAAIAEDSGVRLITQAQLLANATDVDGPGLTATGLTIASGAGALVDNGNGTWNYTPALNDDTGASFSYSVSDGSLTAAGSASLDITPVNDAPIVVNPISDQAAAEYSAFIFTFTFNTFNDADVGDTLTYTTSTLPAWLSFDANTRTFRAAQTNIDVGTITITVIATDTSGASVADSFDIVIANNEGAFIELDKTSSRRMYPGMNSFDTATNLNITFIKNINRLTTSLDNVPVTFQTLESIELPAIVSSDLPNSHGVLFNGITPGTGIQVENIKFIEPNTSPNQEISQLIEEHKMALSSIAVSAGLVAWATQYSALFLSVLATIPAWRNLDPVAILSNDEDDPEWDVSEEENEENAEESAADIWSEKTGANSI